MSNLYLCVDEKEKNRLVAQGCSVVEEKTISGKKTWLIHSPDDSFEKFTQENKNVIPARFMAL